MSTTNLPLPITNDSAAATKRYFEQYGQDLYQFSPNDLQTAVSFFKKRGFGDDASLSTGVSILKQAKFENRPVFSLIDTLEGFTDLQLSAIVAEILNNFRKPISILGYRSGNVSKLEAERNIAA